MNIPTKRLKRFKSLFKKSSSCWMWLGTKGKGGYGVFRINGKQIRTHRLAWFIHNGQIPDGLYVLHKCDVRDCVNPKHLFLGTADDNLKDCISKGRFRVASGNCHGTRTHPERVARGNRHGSKTHPEAWIRGSRIPWSKLNENDVRVIRNLNKKGISGCELARRYNVSQRSVSCAIRGETWKHVV